MCYILIYCVLRIYNQFFILIILRYLIYEDYFMFCFFSCIRIIYEDVQGLTGRKKNYMSIPYGSIHKFSKESSGWADWDADLRIWVRGEKEPIKWEFRKDGAVNEIFKILSEGVLSS